VLEQSGCGVVAVERVDPVVKLRVARVGIERDVRLVCWDQLGRCRPDDTVEKARGALIPPCILGTGEEVAPVVVVLHAVIHVLYQVLLQLKQRVGVALFGKGHNDVAGDNGPARGVEWESPAGVRIEIDKGGGLGLAPHVGDGNMHFQREFSGAGVDSVLNLGNDHVLPGIAPLRLVSLAEGDGHVGVAPVKVSVQSGGAHGLVRDRFALGSVFPRWTWLPSIVSQHCRGEE